MPGTLAIDPAKLLGWAHCREPGGPLVFGHVSLGRTGATPGEIGKALSEFLHDRILHLRPDLIVYEQPYIPLHVSNFQTIFVLLGITFLIDTISRQWSTSVASIISTEATKAMTGRASFPGHTAEERRRNKKRATVEACRARGWEVTADEADAIAILLLAEAKRHPLAARLRPQVLRQPLGPLFPEATLAEPNHSS